jgi:hypothetical protein
LQTSVTCWANEGAELVKRANRMSDLQSTVTP